MSKYQLLYIIDNGLSDEEKQAQVDKYNELIASLGGTVDATDKWGTRKFAYAIEKKTEGFYVHVKFTAGADVPTEIDRQMRISDVIIRQMITRI